MKEIWKDVLGYEGHYKASNLGNVWSVRRGKMMVQGLNKFGYCRIGLYKDGKPKSFGVHRLVLAAFTGKFGLEVNHIDGIKTNNNIENLEWVNRSENLKHAIKNGLFKIYKGDKHINAKLSEKEVLEIRKKYIPYFYSQYKLAKEYGVSQRTMSTLVRNLTYKSDLLKRLEIE